MIQQLSMTMIAGNLHWNPGCRHALVDEKFKVSWADQGPYSFIGSVDPDHHTFQGTWHGRGFRCSDNGPQGGFTRNNIK